MIRDARIRQLNDRQPTAGDYVLYWMQQSQRAAGNPALECAISAANRHRLPVLVGFGLTDAYPEANRRHYAFMLQGLQEVERALRQRGIGFVIRRGEPAGVAIDLAARAALVVCDRGYLRHQKQWRAAVARASPCRVVQVEGDVVVPVEEASDRHEVAARTLRPKLNRLWDDYLTGLDETAVERDAKTLRLKSDVDLADVEQALDRLDLDGSVAPVRRFRGGTSAARERLGSFLEGGLAGYAAGRSEPGAFQCSQLSPYLHFGQISPVEIALEVRAAAAGKADDRSSYLEELIVRRELSMNFVNFNERYDRYDCLPDWAQDTLSAHRADRREHTYSIQQLERDDTHDRYWNAAMSEMIHTGYMHNYMRMYWAKKILEWSPTPEDAFATTLRLNNKYFLDGRDANSYANVAWTFGLHDRPWPERPVFGKVRYMNAKGLERKFDMKSYLYAVDRLVGRERNAD
ncbi:MAG TPA: deoxyribodipyrimidine photo-lyase [Geminicoccaceae bacterium]|nr:deoxyribodipyrimidine photo-lyase [Geminicoccaceae bacterium]